ncbi:MAG: ferredoxin-type protein NapG [Candidatus Accumulibacter sp.]|jgi:ferredoxin-type protein NapG|nr:ferredoxin-type protein NapG [Accumulibacter sp.]
MNAAKPSERAGAPGMSRVSPARRKFLAGMAGAAGSGCLLAMGAGLYARQARGVPALALRPPGALPEDEFLAACTRCGLCVRDCPYDALRLAAPGDPVPTGTPYFIARDVPCEMCDDIPCLPNCPTGALDPKLTDIARARMGLAVLVDHETCLNFLGLRCDVCYRVCPAIGQAITLERQHNARSDRHAMLLPTVHSEHCTGCGKCEKACVLEEAAIRVLPFALARGRLGGHYRKGWEEREKHGGSLIGEQVELPVRGLEGKAYGDTRVDDAPPPAPGENPAGIDSRWKP